MQNYKITVSGWPGAGSSTLAILLSHSLKLKLYQGGELFRFFYKRISSETGTGRVQGQEIIEPIIGELYDKYIDKMLASDKYNQILIESDIASFRVGKLENVASVFLVASQESRKARAQVDGRPSDGEEMEKIDRSHEQEYNKLHRINWFDQKEIKQKHNLIIYNDKLTIAQELDEVYKNLKDKNFISQDKYNDLVRQSKTLEEDFWSKGKDFFKQKLKEEGIILTGEDLIRDMWSQFYDTMKSIPQPFLSWIEEIL